VGGAQAWGGLRIQQPDQFIPLAGIPEDVRHDLGQPPRDTRLVALAVGVGREILFYGRGKAIQALVLGTQLLGQFQRQQQAIGVG